MTTTVDIWSDIHCPWAYIAVHRLRRARDTHGLDVVFVPRAWPLEWVNRHGTPRAVVTTETAALASHEPDLFTAFTDESWPSTFLPAFELVATARRLYGVRAAEDVDFALRQAFFRDSVDVSIRAGLHEALVIASGLNADVVPADVEDAWLSTNPRADVAEDFRTSAGLPIQGSPQIFWPDGSTTHNPGMTDHRWHGGLVHIGHTEPGEAERLLLARTAGSRE
ncbi:DsbA family oxidoreductase [Lentzea aerocolonigenes]|uniref:DsbA family oxidoreductase n=1 Tax=Lentzea aerocolonigenes TaxID=68170 RepID=UPI0004C392CF|nr:DsbA family protein [Lentzea aerocolonigenes]MCP2244002.1 putative dithiol-disulfide isomerase, DsbA family [Lentzea aerocolonigenes]